MADATNGNGDDRGPVGHVLDLFVFAPLGFLAESHTIVPKLAESGRQHIGSRVQLARMVGQFAVQQGRHQAAKVVSTLRASAEQDGPEAPAGGPHAETAAVDDDDERAEELLGAGPSTDDGGIAEEDLAIPSYDSLAASQVVPRLDGLSS